MSGGSNNAQERGREQLGYRRDRGGPAGENAAHYAIKHSDRTAVIVEAELLGGEVLLLGVLSAQGVVAPRRVARRGPGVARVEEVVLGPVDVPGVLGRRDEFVHHHDDSGQVESARVVGVDVIRGSGRLVGPKSVEVTAADGSVSAVSAREAVVIATCFTGQPPRSWAG